MQGRFANVAAYDDIELPTWKDFSPRLSAVYNLSGDGKTAVRVGYNKFVTAQTTGFAQLYNPTALTTQELAWTDVNGDDIADGERGCAGYPSVGCEINFAGLPSNFGVRSLAQFDPDLKRPYQLAFNAGITHEVLTGLTLVVRVLPQRLPQHHRAPELAAHRGQLRRVQRRQPARRQQSSRCGCRSRASRRRSPTSTAPATT